jgi:hypothetical protein
MLSQSWRERYQDWIEIGQGHTMPYAKIITTPSEKVELTRTQ